MENRPGRQNKRQPTSEGEEGEECSAIYDRTNYHIWSLFSRQSDGLLQLNLDPSLKDNFVLCNGAFSDKTGKSKCSFCFPFLVLSCLIAFVSIQQRFFTFSNMKKNQSKQNIIFPKLPILPLYSHLHPPHHAQF